CCRLAAACGGPIPRQPARPTPYARCRSTRGSAAAGPAAGPTDVPPERRPVRPCPTPAPRPAHDPPSPPLRPEPHRSPRRTATPVLLRGDRHRHRAIRHSHGAVTVDQLG